MRGHKIVPIVGCSELILSSLLIDGAHFEDDNSDDINVVDDDDYDITSITTIGGFYDKNNAKMAVTMTWVLHLLVG